MIKENEAKQWLSGILQHKSEYYGVQVKTKNVLFKLLAAVAINGEISMDHWKRKIAPGFSGDKQSSFLETAKLMRIATVEDETIKAHNQLIRTIERELLDAETEFNKLLKKLEWKN